VFTFPLRQDGGRLGALDLYRTTPGPLDSDDLDAAQTLADVATAYLVNAKSRDLARVTSDAFRYGALHDSLTGLPNRLLLQQRLEHAARRAKRSKTFAAILFADLDRFKLVNDTYGHVVGDELLIAVASRLTALVRPGDTLARFAGDEFVFLCEELHTPADVELVAQRVQNSFAEPFVLHNLTISVTASVGMAAAGYGGDISEALIVDADVAMYQAKRKGGATHQTLDLDEASARFDRSTLESDLRSALSAGSLDVAYQPIVRCADNVVTGVEALLRWRHPTRGRVPATAMVATAERSGLIVPVGAWLLERSCADHARWLAEHPQRPLDLAVNVSGRQLMSPGYVEEIAGVLTRSGMDPAALILEITESILVDDTDRALSILDSLKQLGVRLAMDDFGTGYSSLSYLHRLPLDIIKIDQSFVDQIDSRPTSSAIVAAVTNLGHVLGLSVTAEGVETQTQRDAVVAAGCECAQGYFFAHPMSAAAIGDGLRTSFERSIDLTDGPAGVGSPAGLGHHGDYDRATSA
jgi:diguanylate cyclase (GGDEF)-like protein